MRCGSELTWHPILSHHRTSAPSHAHIGEDDKALCGISISSNFIPKEEKKKEFLHERKTVLSPRQSEKSQATTSE